MLSSDSNLFDTESGVFARMQLLAEEVGNLDVIVLSRAGKDTRILSSGLLRVFGLRTRCRLLSGLGAMFHVRRLRRPDVVTAQDPFEIGLAALVIARFLHVPLHVQVHTDIGSASFASSSILNRVRVLIARFVLPRASHIRAVSERVRRGVQRFAPHIDVSVLPISINVLDLIARADSSKLEPRFAKFETVILVVARLETEKNVAFAIEAFAQAAPQSACLVILGDGRERAELERVARAHNLEGRVFFDGKHDPGPYFALADLLLSTSYFEGDGMVIVEALALGVPVLSTDVGVAREAGAMVTSPEQFTDSLREWFSSGARSSQLRISVPTLDEYVHAFGSELKRCAEGVKSL